MLLLQIMIDFIRKKAVWDAVDSGYLNELDNKISYQLKTAQDLAVYSRLRDLSGVVIGEVGGGNCRILPRLARKNRCFNIDKFEGMDEGPKGVVALEAVENIIAFVGDFEPALRSEFFDVVFSISVVEHVHNTRLDAFHGDVMRILKPGGMFLHAVDMYIDEKPSNYHKVRYGTYRGWVCDNPQVDPIEPVGDSILRFQCDMATNPDNVMYEWQGAAPALNSLRSRAQLVSLLIGGRKLA